MPQKRPRFDWYDRRAAAYNRARPDLAGEREFYRRLARTARPPLLVLACGTGRIALDMAAVAGPVVGLDRSAAMLAVARAAAKEVPSLHWVRGDMRAFAFRCRFGLICIPFRSLQHLLTDADQLAALRCCVEHLQPGGRLAFSLGNPQPLRRLLARFAPARQRPAAASALRGGHPQAPVRYWEPDEVRVLLEAAGLAVERMDGGFSGEPLTPRSMEQVWVARRPA
jgi:SAM-dependent methyltransferase